MRRVLRLNRKCRITRWIVVRNLNSCGCPGHEPNVILNCNAYRAGSFVPAVLYAPAYVCRGERKIRLSANATISTVFTNAHCGWWLATTRNCCPFRYAPLDPLVTHTFAHNLPNRSKTTKSLLTSVEYMLVSRKVCRLKSWVFVSEGMPLVVSGSYTCSTYFQHWTLHFSLFTCLLNSFLSFHYLYCISAVFRCWLWGGRMVY